MSRPLLDQIRFRHSSGASSAPWRGATVHLICALAVAVLPSSANATTAADICASTDDPCMVIGTVQVTDGSLIDVGTRHLEVAKNGALSLISGGMTLHAGALTIDKGGNLFARGGLTNSGGDISATADTITVNGSIDASGAPGGTLTLTSTAAFVVAGPIDVDSRSPDDGGGSLTLQGGDVTVAAAGSLSAVGGSQDSGGDITVLASGALAVNGGINASGGDGGSVTLTPSGPFSLAANVTIDADASLTSGDGGEITLSAGGDITLAGTLSAVGRNGTADDSAGDGGTISIEGNSIALTPAAARITVAAGSSDGTGGDIALTSDSGAIDVRGQIVASGPGVDGLGGTISIDAAGTATISGAVTGTGGSGGGGDLEVSSIGADLTVAAGASLSVAAISSGDGGTIQVSAGASATISGSLIADGGNATGGTGGSIDVGGCTVRINGSGSLSSQRSGGKNTLTGRDITFVQGTLRADPSGQNVIRFAGPDYAPVILPGAQINPVADLVVDASVMPCNPVNTRTPMVTGSAVATPTATATAPGGATPTVTATRTRSTTGGASPTATPTHTATPRGAVCVGDCQGLGTVTVPDLIIGVNIALGNQPIGNCPAFDPDDSGMVAVSELVQGVNNALDGCP